MLRAHLCRGLLNIYFQVGLVSFGPTRCGDGLPGVYTNVASYMDWIINNLKPWTPMTLGITNLYLYICCNTNIILNIIICLLHVQMVQAPKSKMARWINYVLDLRLWKYTIAYLLQNFNFETRSKVDYKNYTSTFSDNRSSTPSLDWCCRRQN